MTNSDLTLQQLRIIELEDLVKLLEEENDDLEDADRSNTSLILEMSESGLKEQQSRIRKLERLICNLREFVTFQEFTDWRNNMHHDIEDILENNENPAAD